VGVSLNKVKEYLNEVPFREGIDTPYDTNDFYTRLMFRRDAMILILENQYKF